MIYDLPSEIAGMNPAFNQLMIDILKERIWVYTNDILILYNCKNVFYEMMIRGCYHHFYIHYTDKVEKIEIIRGAGGIGYTTIIYPADSDLNSWV